MACAADEVVARDVLFLMPVLLVVGMKEDRTFGWVGRALLK
jgi:hypothetical protein